MIILMAAALSGADVSASGGHDEVAYRHAAILTYLDYEDCLRDEALKLDFMGKRLARTDAEAAVPKCHDAWSKFALMFLGDVDQPTARDRQSLENFRSLAIDTAAAELVEAKRGSCGTQSGPYQCKGFAQHVPQRRMQLKGDWPH